MAIATGTAILAGAAISAGVGIYSANKAEEAADKDRKARDRASKDAMSFAEQRQERWESVFGPVQDNLADYYGSLNSDDYASEAMQEFEQERTQALTKARETLAQRGLATSGAAAATEIASELNRATTRATIQRNAPRQVAEEKMGFLQLGMRSNPDAATQNQMNVNAALAEDQAQASQNQAADQAATATGAVVDTVQAGIDYFTEPGASSTGLGDAPDEFSYNYG